MTVRLDPVDRALADIGAGRPVVVLDAQDRENEADLIVPAESISPELAAFFVRHTSGVLCAAMEPDRLSHLGIPLMLSENAESMRTAFTVTVDAAQGVTTGISAADRTRTLHVLADEASTRDDLVRPGHLFPLRARAGGVLTRAGHTEAAVDLCRLAGRTPVGVLAELVAEDGPVLRAEAARLFADEHGLALISIAQLITHRRAHEQLLTRTVTTRLPTPDGDLTLHGYASQVDDSAHLALVAGDPASVEEVLVRVHSECLTGDALGSRRCDCGPQLDAALTAISREGTGVVVYLRDHEGRGIGLLPKLAAYALQDGGHDTVEANLALGLPADARDYWAAAQILRDLGVRRVRLLTNNPAKHAGLEAYGLTVTQSQPLLTDPTPDNAGYLATKRERLGHRIPLCRGNSEAAEGVR